MLVLKRKPNESITIGNNITVKVLACKNTLTILGIDAPNDVVILRDELRNTLTERSTITILMTKAFNSARKLGHTIQWQQSIVGNINKVKYGSCIRPNCSAWIMVETNPQFSSINIGGPAVALNCPACEEDCC